MRTLLTWWELLDLDWAIELLLLDPGPPCGCHPSCQTCATSGHCGFPPCRAGGW